MNPKHGGPELSPLTLNFAGKLSGAIHDIIQESRSAATVVNMELYTNIFDPLKCSAGSTDGKIVFYIVHLCLKILILSIPVVKKGLRSHSQSRGSVKGQR